jgi:hypothetical protein
MLWQDFAFRSEEDIDRAAAKRRCMAYLRSVFPGRFAQLPGARETAPGAGAAGGFAGWAYGDPRAALLERDGCFDVHGRSPRMWRRFPAPAIS